MLTDRQTDKHGQKRIPPPLYEVNNGGSNTVVVAVLGTPPPSSFIRCLVTLCCGYRSRRGSSRRSVSSGRVPVQDGKSVRAGVLPL